MKFNGVDPTTVHSAISISKEIPPGGPARDIATIETANGEMVANVTTTQDEFVVRVNIAAKTYDEAMEAREKLAAWAASSGKQEAELEPTHMPGKAYSAIWKRTGRMEQRFGTVDVVFMLPKPVLHSKAQRTATNDGVGNSVTIEPYGTAPAPFEIVQRLSEAAEGVALDLNGEVFATLTGAFAEGDRVTVNTETGEVLINSYDAGSRLDFVNTNPDMELAPGTVQSIASSAQGTIIVRWRDQWL